MMIQSCIMIQRCMRSRNDDTKVHNDTKLLEETELSQKGSIDDPSNSAIEHSFSGVKQLRIRSKLMNSTDEAEETFEVSRNALDNQKCSF